MRDTVSTRRSAIVPLLPYVVPGLEMKSIWSTALTFVTLFLLGASRALVTVGRWWRSGAETLRRVSVKARLRDSGSGFE